MRWLKKWRLRKADNPAKYALELAGKIISVLPQENVQLTVYAHRVPDMKVGFYAKKVDAITGQRGQSGSRDGTAWIKWEIGKLEFYIFKGGV